jgi:hypothetical protein
MSPTESSGRKRAKHHSQTPLPASLDKNLHAYVTAACAAGVSLLACSPPAAAEIVYTPANSFILPKGTLSLDLNHDGTVDFQFSNLATKLGSGYSGKGTLTIRPFNAANAVWEKGTYASALAGGVRVGPNQHFQRGHGKMVRSNWAQGENGYANFYSHGPWVDVTKHYLGLKFSIAGQTHYGWARLNVTVTFGGLSKPGGIYAVLTGYAYETVPNTPIVTGKTKGAAADVSGTHQSTPASFAPSPRPPASLGLLARGTGALDIWRKRQATTN